ncbi:hypothetical protein RUND412_011630, partial [Rhizina undulata]
MSLQRIMQFQLETVRQQAERGEARLRGTIQRLETINLQLLAEKTKAEAKITKLELELILLQSKEDKSPKYRHKRRHRRYARSSSESSGGDV